MQVCTRTLVSMVLFTALAMVLTESRALAKAPEVFSTKTAAEARREAKDAGKLFILDATATWCGPCKQMDKTTWIDEKVVAWIEEHAIAAQLDVDKNKALSQTLKISAMPTVIVFKDDEEFDRIVGYRNGADLLTWLNGVNEGKRDIDRVKAAAGSRDKGDGKVDIQARYQLAQTLMRSGKFDEATEEYVWLWDNMLAHAPAMSGVRLSFMIGDMKTLAQQHSPANDAFTKLRDRYQPAMDDGTASREQIIDWSRLNQVIGDDGALIAWYDRVKDNPDRAKAIQEAERELFGELIERGRWSDAGQLCADPAGRARMYVMGVKTIKDFQRPGVSDDQRKDMVETTTNMSRDQIAQLYAACLAAGRNASAEEVANIALKELDDFKTRLALVDFAMKAKQPRAVQLQWLDEAEAAGERNDRLRESLEAALKNSKD